ncbi:hypothetical protein V6N13_038421 [Hibiscus sabdariffa]
MRHPRSTSNLQERKREREKREGNSRTEEKDPSPRIPHSKISQTKRNPSFFFLLERKHERVSSKCLEEARKSFGTDEDLLLISLEESRRSNYSAL